MSKNFNQFSCIARMTKDIEIKTVGEHKLGVFSAAINGRKDTDVMFMDFKVWNKQAEILEQYTKKGSKIFLCGEMAMEKWESDGKKHSRIVCNVQTFEFLDSKPKEESNSKKVADNFENPFDSDELPF